MGSNQGIILTVLRTAKNILCMHLTWITKPFPFPKDNTGGELRAHNTLNSESSLIDYQLLSLLNMKLAKFCCC